MGGPCQSRALCLVKMYLLLTLVCVFSLCLLWRRWPLAWRPPASEVRRNLTVLLWHWPFDRPLSLDGDPCWDMYRVPGCRLVARRSLFPSADVVVFHNRELARRRGSLPSDLPRPAGQRWAWMSLEAPSAKPNLRRFSNVFNMTVTYRRDADVTIPYGELQPGASEGSLADAAPANKSFLACWVVSNFRSQQERSRVYRELRAMIPVKVYGRWARAPLPADALLPTVSRCYFYLAFENTVSRDYITEKLWRNSYQGGAVPVVLGPPVQDYAAVAPPRSFIHVDDFASTRDLADFLQQVAADGRRYAGYFSWRRSWKVKLLTDWRERLCRICSRFPWLPQHRVYADLQGWVRADLR